MRSASARRIEVILGEGLALVEAATRAGVTRPRHEANRSVCSCSCVSVFVSRSDHSLAHMVQSVQPSVTNYYLGFRIGPTYLLVVQRGVNSVRD